MYTTLSVEAWDDSHSGRTVPPHWSPTGDAYREFTSRTAPLSAKLRGAHFPYQNVLEECSIGTKFQHPPSSRAQRPNHQLPTNRRTQKPENKGAILDRGKRYCGRARREAFSSVIGPIVTTPTFKLPWLWGAAQSRTSYKAVIDPFTLVC